jgi:hypothetical protein
MNTDSPKYTFMHRHLNAGQNLNVMRTNKCFENAAYVMYLEMPITDLNYIQGEVRTI